MPNQYTRRTFSPVTSSARFIRMTAIVTVATLFFWVSGAGAAPFMNQLMNMGTSALTTVMAGFSSLSSNGTTIAQDSDADNANQAADADADANADLAVDGDLTADNVVVAAQTAVADQSNQEMTGGLDADLLADVTADAAAESATDIAQEASGDGPTNQDADSEAGAETDVEVEVAGTALNVLTAEQESDGEQANQALDTQADANGDGVVVIAGAATAIGSTSQTSNGGPANQYVTNVFNANTFINTLQNITSMNILNILQTCNGQCNQVANVVANAIANGLQAITGNSTVIADLSQDASGDGSANQAMDASNGAETDIAGDQSVLSFNTIGLEQDGGESSNQQADITADSAADGVQVLTGNSVIVVDASQTAGGDGAANQNADLENDSASDVDGDQAVLSFNIIDASQTNDGDQGNQQADIDADSTADGTQVLDGTSVIVLTVGQNADGDGGINQNATADNDSAVDVDAGQAVVSFNMADLEQVNDGDQGNQAADIALDSNAEGDQAVAGGSVIVAGIEQDASGTNQNAEMTNDSAADVSAGQEIVSTNAANVSQSADADQGAASQSVEIDAGSDATGSQNVAGASVIVSGIGQNADGDGMHNQNAEIDSGSTASVGALQGVIALNEIAASQEADVDRGAAAQSMIIEPEANADAEQNVSGQSANVSAIEQSADGDDSKQAADITTNAGTDVNAGQTATAINVIDASQEQDINQGAGAQWMLIAPLAGVMATQNVSGDSGNVSGITQEDGGDMNNQQAAIDASSNTDVNAGQDALAVNNLNLQQRATTNQGAVAQAGEAAPVAQTTANQNVAGSSGNVSGITQEGGSGDQGNQNADIGANSDTSVDADQNAAAVNNLNVMQECDVTRGACAQYFNANPTATTTANQDVSGTSGNVTDVSQEGGSGGQGNQDATVDNAAATDVTAGQNAASGNTTTITQVCTVNQSVCAQYAEADFVADTQAEQNITGDASNTTTVEQSGGGDQANQAADVTDSATTAIDAVQDAASLNDAAIMQTGEGNQAASATGTADTTSTVNITGTSSNTTAIVQE